MRGKSTGTVRAPRLPIALVAAATLTLTLAAASSAQAANCDYTWGGSNHGNWINPAKWVQNAVPTANSNVCINSGSAVLRHVDPSPPALASLAINGPGGLTVKSGQAIDSAATTIGPGGWLFAGHVPRATGPGTVSLSGGPVVNEGKVIVAPGVTLEQTGGSFQNAATGRMVARISKLGFGVYRFDDGVSFSAGGTLNPVLIGGPPPPSGQRFALITGSTLSGRFTKIGRNFTADYGQPGAIVAVYSPTTPPPPPSARGVAQVQSAVLAGRGIVRLRVSCPASGGVCSRLRYRIAVTIRARHRGRARVLTVARGRIPNLRPDGDETIQLQLGGAGIGPIRRHRVLRVVVVVREYGQVISRSAVCVPSGGGFL